MTAFLFRDDAYLKSTQAIVTGISERGGILLDRSNFYAMSGGQPGDTGTLIRQNGSRLVIGATEHGEDKTEIIHVPAEPGEMPEIGETIVLELDWERRHAHMRMHTALHLLSVALPYAVTGGSIGEQESRLDFDIREAGLEKEDITHAVNALMQADHAISEEWITDAELEANPSLVKTMSVKPPRGAGRVRLIRIGDIDLQPCGGTHVRSTMEIGPILVSKIEKKGRQNRRVRIRFA